MTTTASATSPLAHLRDTLVAFLEPAKIELAALTEEEQALAERLSEVRLAKRRAESIIAQIEAPLEQPAKKKTAAKKAAPASSNRVLNIEKVWTFLEEHRDEIGDEFNSLGITEAMGRNGGGFSRSSTATYLETLHSRGVITLTRSESPRHGGRWYALTEKMA